MAIERIIQFSQKLNNLAIFSRNLSVVTEKNIQLQEWEVITDTEEGKKKNVINTIHFSSLDSSLA